MDARTWPRVVAHADMDAFYAAVEQLDDPSLRGRPVLVGPRSWRGVVLTASYEARPYGVGSAMPVAEARRRCPHAVMVEPRFGRYEELSRQVMDVFADFSPVVEPISLDEAFLDMSGAERLFGPPPVMAKRIRDAVREATGLAVSVGVSATKYVAKVASACAKPDGLLVVAPQTARRWLAPLPVSRLWGAGRKTVPRLEALGYHTIGDIAGTDPALLADQLGSAGAHFHELAHARDPRRVDHRRRAASVGSDRTLSHDVTARRDIEMHLRRAADRLERPVVAGQRRGAVPIDHRPPNHLADLDRFGHQHRRLIGEAYALEVAVRIESRRAGIRERCQEPIAVDRAADPPAAGRGR